MNLYLPDRDDESTGTQRRFIMNLYLPDRDEESTGTQRRFIYTLMYTVSG
jgi:hypothetical protein